MSVPYCEFVGINGFLAVREGILTTARLTDAAACLRVWQAAETQATDDGQQHRLSTHNQRKRDTLAHFIIRTHYWEVGDADGP